MVSRSTETDAEVGGYHIRGRIAVGGMSEVFAAENDAGAHVALKVLLPELAATPEGREAFAHEAELGDRFAHDNIVRVLGHGEHARGPFIVLEWVTGASLAACAQAHALGTDAVLVVASDLLAALEQVHRASDERGQSLEIVHRDMSPDNVLVTDEGVAKLTDFGIARSRLRDRRTKTGIIRGKAHYLSPEQVTGSEVDARADIYALGCVLFELATQQRHVEGDADLEVLRAAEAPVFRKPSSLGADPVLDALLERALARFPEERFQSARAMKSKVAALLAERGEGATERGRAELAERARLAARVFPEATRARSSRRFPWLVAAAASAVTAAIAYVSLGSGPSDSDPTAPSSPAAPQNPIASASATAIGDASVVEVASISPPGAPSATIEASSEPTATSSATSRPPSSAMAAVKSSAPSVASSSSVPPEPTSTASTPPIDTATRLQAKMKAISERLKRAKADGHDVRGLEARSAVALQAYLDGRYDDTDRELDAIAAALPR